ncbi:UNVERIFIED_ORG: hypothetical protein ABIB19_001961 [Arthrobacter sp. UYEF10]
MSSPPPRCVGNCPRGPVPEPPGQRGSATETGTHPQRWQPPEHHRGPARCRGQCLGQPLHRCNAIWCDRRPIASLTTSYRSKGRWSSTKVPAWILESAFGIGAQTGFGSGPVTRAAADVDDRTPRRLCPLRYRPLDLLVRLVHRSEQRDVFGRALGIRLTNLCLRHQLRAYAPVPSGRHDLHEHMRRVVKRHTLTCLKRCGTLLRSQEVVTPWTNQRMMDNWESRVQEFCSQADDAHPRCNLQEHENARR